MNRLSTAFYEAVTPVVAGKEWLGADGRDEYDFHARRQYPHLGIFTTPDPHAESCHDISPYAYCAGNPIMFIDPTGMNGVKILDVENKTIVFKAEYYVNMGTMPSKYADNNIIEGYTLNDINQLNIKINDYFNKKT